MKKYLKAALLCICVLCFALGAAACTDRSSGEKDPGFHYRTVSGQKVLYDYVPEEGVTKVTIAPDVDKIQAGAFGGNGTIKEIVVESNVTEIGAGAFAGMTALESITLPFTGESADAVNEKKTFGYVFGTEEYDGGVAVTQTYGSSSATYYLPETLRNVTINAGEGVATENDAGETAYEGYKLAAYAFHSMNRLRSITLAGNITAIGDYAFYGCYELRSFAVPQTVESIGKQAFVNCTRLNGIADTGAEAANGNVSFAENSELTSIGDYAFAGTKLTEIDLSGQSKLTTLGEGAFASTIVAAASVTDGTETELNSRLESVTLPQTVTEIPTRAFYDCAYLEQVIYSDTITAIRTDAFAKCDALRLVKNVSATETLPEEGTGVIVLPSTVVKVYAGAFVNVGNSRITYTLVNDDSTYFADGWKDDTKWADEQA